MSFYEQNLTDTAPELFLFIHGNHHPGEAFQFGCLDITIAPLILSFVGHGLHTWYAALYQKPFAEYTYSEKAYIIPLVLLSLPFGLAFLASQLSRCLLSLALLTLIGLLVLIPCRSIYLLSQSEFFSHSRTKKLSELWNQTVHVCLA